RVKVAVWIPIAEASRARRTQISARETGRGVADETAAGQAQTKIRTRAASIRRVIVATVRLCLRDPSSMIVRPNTEPHTKLSNTAADVVKSAHCASTKLLPKCTVVPVM